MDSRQALAQINRFLASVDALTKATKAETTADSVEDYLKKYSEFQEEADMMAATVNYLKYIGYPHAMEIWPAGVDRALWRHQKPNQIFDAGKLVGGYSVELACWLRQLEQALLKARKWLKAQKQSKRKRKDEAYVWLNATETARYIGTTSKTITTWIRSGTLQVYEENGTKYRLLRSELDAKKTAFRPRNSRKTAN